MSDTRKLSGEMNELSRRAFMSMTASRLLAVGLAPYALSSTAFAGEGDGTPASVGGKAKNVIYLYMSGGMSHIDTWDPKPGTEWQGSTQSISTNVDGVQIAASLPRMAKMMDRVALVRSLNSKTGAHYPGYYYMHTGYPERGTIRHPEMGSWIHRLKGKGNETLPGTIQIGGGSRQVDQGFLEATYAPLRVSSPKDGLQNVRTQRGMSKSQLDSNLELADKFDSAFRKKYDKKAVRAYSAIYDEAVRLMSSEDLAAFDLEKEPMKLRDRYGDDSFAQGCLLARRLVERDVRFVEVNLGGWDTHDNNFERVEDRAGILDQALSALLEDLEGRGMLDSTLVVVATEFGRKPDIDQHTDGRGHWPKAFSGLLIGGGIRGGQVIGATDERAGEIAERPISVPDFNATIAHAVGLPQDERIYSPSGRPFTVADKGRPIAGV